MKSIQNVAVIGLGTMGHGIAQAYAAAGLRVYAFDEVAAARTSLHARVRQNLQQFVRAGLATKRSVEPTLKRIVVCDTLEAAVREAQFVTETVREDLKTKQELLAKLEGMGGPQTILASNSSTFPISASGARLRRPGRAIVTHWFNPPHIVPTVEVVPGRRTSAATTRAALALLTRVGKQAIHLRKEVPGFLVNRIQIAMTREVWSMLDEGVASVDDIDRAIRGSLGFRLAAIGPLEVADFGGSISMPAFSTISRPKSAPAPGCPRRWPNWSRPVISVRRRAGAFIPTRRANLRHGAPGATAGFWPC